MGEYTPQIEAQIARLLAQRGSATPDDLAGVDEADGAKFLRVYAEVHAEEGLVLDGSILTQATPATPAGGMPEPTAATPVSSLDAPPTSGGAELPPPPWMGTAKEDDGVPPPPPGAYEPSVFPEAPPPDMTPEPTRQRVSGWFWLLPIVFSLVGGVIAWAVNKDKDPLAARNFLIAGFVVFGLNICLLVGSTMLSAGEFVSAVDSMPTDTAWPASTTGRPTFYYFGSPG